MTYLVKKIRLQSYARHVDVPVVMNRLEAPCGAGGGPPEREGPQGRPLPPLLCDMGYDVCSLGSPKKFIMTHAIHPDHCPAITDIKLVASEPVIRQIEKYASYYYREEYNVEVVEFKGEFCETEHWTFDVRRSKYLPALACCYVLAEVKAFLICESSTANKFLEMARMAKLTPLYMWQPRDHVNHGVTLHAKDIYDGYFIDTRSWDAYADNVIPKCVPSILDVKMDPAAHRGNPYAERILREGRL
jgi:hypothetical protein